jgi:hypothetical protein
VFDAIWSDEYQTIQGQRARKITLMEADGLSVAGHCWISEDLGLVLREEVQMDGQAMSCRVTQLEQREPTEDVLRVPPDFTEAKPGGKK